MIDNHPSQSPATRLRREAIAFLVETSTELSVLPITKYSALSLFADRFLPSLMITPSKQQHWLLQKPITLPTLHLFSLISLWISSKIHNSPPLPLNSLKLVGDKRIKDQHFTRTDYLEAETLFLQCVGFEIGTSRNSVFVMVEELLVKFREVAKVGELVSFEACLDVLDLVYESEEVSRLFVGFPVCLAAAVVVAAVVMTVPKQRAEFPVVGWVNFVSGCREEDVVCVVKAILELIVR